MPVSLDAPRCPIWIARAIGACLFVASATVAAAPPAPIPTGGRRTVPDYDGRGEAPLTALDVALWVPRVALFPAYLASEYLVRRPLGFVASAAENGTWLQDMTSPFRSAESETRIERGVVPTAMIDSGLRSSFGAYLFWDDVGAPGNDLRIHAATGGADWLRLTIVDRVRIDDGATVKLRGEAFRRPDGVFYGTGPRSLERDRVRFGSDTLAGRMSFAARLSRALTLDASAGVNRVRFRPDTCCDDPSLALRIAEGRVLPPVAYPGGYAAYSLGLKLAVDSRDRRPQQGTGVRALLEVEHDMNLDAPAKGRWVTYGGTVTGSLDLTQHDRVLGLSVTTLFVDPLGEDDVPFTELVSLGGDTLMRGFLGGRLLGRSAATATIEYRYPIWAFLDGALAVSTGNAFGEHLRDIDPRLLRLSFWAGLRSPSERDHAVDLLIGTGTETFADGARLNDARVVIGAKRGF